MDECHKHTFLQIYIKHLIKSHKTEKLGASSLDLLVTQLHYLLGNNSKSRDSSVGIALGYGLNDRASRVRFPAGAGNFSLHHRV
jgi:hypothetical protein